jgi:hypothetical protein
MHERHDAEISKKELIQHFERALPDLGRPAGDARALVEEIRDRSGLLVERRPGSFAFSHLTFQEYLCALEFVRTKDLADLVGHYEAPWWHEVIVLAAPGAGGGNIPGKLLALNNPTAVFLAAQCLETEADMPFRVREAVEEALSKLVPPRSWTEALVLRLLGAVAAPILAKSLLQNKSERVLVLRALERTEFEPALPAIAECADDTQDSGVTFVLSRGDIWQLTVGGYATLVLFGSVQERPGSEVATNALRAAVQKTPLEDLKKLAEPNAWPEELRAITRAALKARQPEPSPSTAAESTA